MEKVSSAWKNHLLPSGGSWSILPVYRKAQFKVNRNCYIPPQYGLINKTDHSFEAVQFTSYVRYPATGRPVNGVLCFCNNKRQR